MNYVTSLIKTAYKNRRQDLKQDISICDNEILNVYDENLIIPSPKSSVSYISSSEPQESDDDKDIGEYMIIRKHNRSSDLILILTAFNRNQHLLILEQN